MSDLGQGHPIVLYDGVCALCNGWVKFILRHDRAGTFRFAALQSAFGAGLLRTSGLDPQDLSSIVLLSGGRIHRRSDAVLEICRQLPRPWNFLHVFRFIPRLLRDFGYNCIARVRYRLFGRYPACSVPSSEVRQRFLD